MKRIFLATLSALVLLAGSARAQDTTKRGAPWDPEVVDTFRKLPVQELGRVKPLDTLAGFKLLKFRGVRSCPTPQGETLSPMAWLLDVLFYPQQANTYEVFLVEDSAVIDVMGLSFEKKKKRDRYSYDELVQGRAKLMEQAQQAMKVDEKSQTSLQQQTLQLAHNLMEYEQLTYFLEFARIDLPLRATPKLQQIFGPEDKGCAIFLAKSQQLPSILEGGDGNDQRAVAMLIQGLQQLLEPAAALNLFPFTPQPVANDPKTGEPVWDARSWLSPALIPVVRSKRLNVDQQIGFLGLLENLERTKTNPAAFKAALGTYSDAVTKLATTRGEYSKVPLEVAFYKAQFFYNGLMLFILSFILVALSWLTTGGKATKLLTKGSLGTLALAQILLVTGIVMRCIIRGRPPVSTLYETILFISAVAVLVACVIEWINRQGIAAALAPALGAMGMFLAYKYEYKESVTAGDTMTSLVAVLDTNFWLSTHVTSVTMGYSAGLLAAAIAHVWLLGKVLGWRKDDDKFYKHIARMTYGVLCFGLLFSTVGTILGGIWANFSWGRFWGWDPKENGALMIVLWELIILHARMGGYIRDYGLCVLSVLGGLVIAFSWWGVNLLGVGLHSYGFTSGILQILVGFNILEVLVVLVSAGWWLAQRNQDHQAITPTESVEA